MPNIKIQQIIAFKNNAATSMTNIDRKSVHLFSLCLVFTGLSFFQPLMAQNETFTIENYYKTRWEFADEFINLWKANHYPLLKKQLKKGILFLYSRKTETS